MLRSSETNSRSGLTRLDSHGRTQIARHRGAMNLAVCFVAVLVLATGPEVVLAQTANNAVVEYSRGRKAPPTEPSVVITVNATPVVPKAGTPTSAARVQQKIARPRPVGSMGPATMPSQEVLLIMVRAALSAVNQANFTDNYSVLHAMATPGLQARVSVAQFGKAFAELRSQNLDLSSALVQDPQFSPAPVLAPGGALKLNGVFPSRPLQISFAIDYLPIGGYWLIDSLSVSVSASRPDALVSASSPASPTLVASADSSAVPATMAFSAPSAPSSQWTKKGSNSASAVGGPLVPAVYVQVSSQRSEAEAQAALRRLQTAYPEIVRPEQTVIRSADLGNKGTFYRAQIGPVSARQARQICGDLKAVGTECFIHYN